MLKKQNTLRLTCSHFMVCNISFKASHPASVMRTNDILKYNRRHLVKSTDTYLMLFNTNSSLLKKRTLMRVAMNSDQEVKDKDCTYHLSLLFLLIKLWYWSNKTSFACFLTLYFLHLHQVFQIIYKLRRWDEVECLELLEKFFFFANIILLSFLIQ